MCYYVCHCVRHFKLHLPKFRIAAQVAAVRLVFSGIAALQYTVTRALFIAQIRTTTHQATPLGYKRKQKVPNLYLFWRVKKRDYCNISK